MRKINCFFFLFMFCLNLFPTYYHLQGILQLFSVLKKIPVASSLKLIGQLESRATNFHTSENTLNIMLRLNLIIKFWGSHTFEKKKGFFVEIIIV